MIAEAKEPPDAQMSSTSSFQHNRQDEVRENSLRSMIGPIANETKSCFDWVHGCEVLCSRNKGKNMLTSCESRSRLPSSEASARKRVTATKLNEVYFALHLLCSREWKATQQDIAEDNPGEM